MNLLKDREESHIQLCISYLELRQLMKMLQSKVTLVLSLKSIESLWFSQIHQLKILILKGLEIHGVLENQLVFMLMLLMKNIQSTFRCTAILHKNYHKLSQLTSLLTMKGNPLQVLAWVVLVHFLSSLRIPQPIDPCQPSPPFPTQLNASGDKQPIKASLAQLKMETFMTQQF
jgi:hypothetical protein